MDTNTTDIQHQYLGFYNSALLWEDDSHFGLQQFRIENHPITSFEDKITNNLRLGKRVERFISHELNENSEISILAENIQIQRDKHTLGELDCILLHKDKPTHLEVVYKFYLYDKTVGDSELEHWIGPNRNDSLIQKLAKLKEKQLPLLFNPNTQPILKQLKLKIKDFEQKVYFKAQLFVPLAMRNKSLELINNNCVEGFYVTLNELKQFSDCQFYIPTKVNWLMEIQTKTDWADYNQVLPEIETLLKNRKSPLCWIKHPNGQLQKCFVIWWY